MGERGQPTRMLAAKYGGYLTFGALQGGKESAPGQPTLHQLQHVYRLPDLTPQCKVLSAARLGWGLQCIGTFTEVPHEVCAWLHLFIRIACHGTVHVIPA